MTIVSISVRDLVEFILRNGDIDNRDAGVSEDAMLEGARIHRSIQKKMGSGYHAEVPLSFDIETEEYIIRIEGRADGIIRQSEGQAGKEKITVDEIKSTYRDIDLMEGPLAVHLAQARCYAYMTARAEGCESIGIQMTYCNIKTEKIRRFNEEVSFEELSAWFDDLIGEYKRWSDMEYFHKIKRKESIKKLEFPFAFREGQKELAGYVYQTICQKKKLFIQAPTGTGKTLSALFPAVKAVGEDKADKIFYLTAKTITRQVAWEAMRQLKGKGLKAKVLILTAKEKICPCEECICDPVSCSCAKGHFDRINDALFTLLRDEDYFDRETILKTALEKSVCPFELSLDLSLFCDVIIGDYNYLFDPYASLKRFFSKGKKAPWVFLVDEAHNLLERGRNMYSASLVKEDILDLKRRIKGAKTSLDAPLSKANKAMLELKKMPAGQKPLSDTDTLNRALLSLSGFMSDFLENHRESAVFKDVLEYYFKLKRYLDVLEVYDEKYITYTSLGKDSRFEVRLFCVDPSTNLAAKMDHGVSSILFSATFLPIQYHKELLGGTDEDYEVYAKTSFSPSQFRVLVAADVTTRYSQRGNEMYERIAGHIHGIISARKGNYLVFFPSYLFLRNVYDAYISRFDDVNETEMLCQTERMTEAMREEFLERFETAPCAGVNDTLTETVLPEKSLAGFCVMGGIFSEGIDLKGESLIGVIVVGTGIPQVCVESGLLKEYFERRGEDGFDYAYRYPGMNKVLQAAGRLIRTSEDRGVIALLDHRFLQSGYRRLFPREWKDIIRVTAEESADAAAGFWNK